MNERITIIFDNQETGEVLDLEIPLNITANDLIIALNNAYKLNMDIDNIFECYLTSENPIAFLKGNKMLEDFGLHTELVLRGVKNKYELSIQNNCK